MVNSVNGQFAITQYPTPVFNTPDISKCFGGNDGDSLTLNDKELMKEVETILFAQTPVELLEQVAQSSIWKIRTDAYNYGGPYYLDERFIRRHPNTPPHRVVSVPPLLTVIFKLNRLVGTRYIWGGNWPEGISLIPHMYPPRTPLNKLPALIQDTWTLKGLDCSGLFYYVSNGFTPRNTSGLLHFGRVVPIEGLTVNEIINKVNDLDLIVWDGHVVGVLDHKTTIESRHPEGVVTQDIKERLWEILKERKPVNNWNESEGPRFVIRRWHPDNR
jgi:hypothetical protein